MKAQNKPLVSFIMPVYNGEEYLSEAVLSVLGQSYKNIELIAVNDGSTDGSLKILEDFAALDKRVKIITQANAGIVAALNTAIKHASGKYLARIDCDDVCFLKRIEKQLPVIEGSEDVVLVCSGFEVIDENSEFMYREIVPTRDPDIKRALLLYNPIAHGSVLMRKTVVEKLGGYSPNCGPTEDYELWMRLSHEGKLLGVEDLLYRWRQNRNGITFTNNKAMQEHSKRNLETYWKSVKVVRMSRSQIINTGNYYLNNSRRYGVDTKNIIYSNISQVSAKLIKHGRFLDGILQLLALASTGRTGLKFARYRVATIILKRLGL